MIRLALRVAIVCSAFGCRPLPSIPEDVCGNGVVESPEDCDGFPQNGIPCRPPGDVAQCRLDCTPLPNNVRSECPLRWGCDSQFVCRPPSGGYREASVAIEGNAWSLETADFNGDLRADILSLEPPGELGYTKIRAHFLDAELRAAKTWVSQKTLATPEVHVSKDEPRAGLVYSDFSINVWRGEPDDKLAPEIYSTYYLQETQVRLLPVADRLVADQTALVLLNDGPKDFGLYRPDSRQEDLLPIVTLPGRLADLAADPAIGDLFEDDERYPCEDLALAYGGAAEVQIYSICERSGTDELAWREEAEITIVPLEPPAPIDAGPMIADMDGDGHLDLLVGAEGVLFIARGDGAGFEPARTRIAHRDPDTPLAELGELSTPLAAGDVTNDGLAELLYPEGMLVSRPSRGGVLVFESSFVRFRAFWSVARIADFNGDGEPDIAAASEHGVDIDFFNGTGTDQINPFSIPTTRPVRHLAVGDIDGDLLNDLIFAQVSPALAEDEVSIAFGNPWGAPDPPVPVAHAHNVRQLVTVVDNMEGSGADLVLLYEREQDSVPGSAIAVLPGAGDRSLPCPVALTNFAEDDSLVSAPSVATALGAFLEREKTDVLALGLACVDPLLPCILAERTPELWLLPDLASHASAPQRLGWPAGLLPSVFQPTSGGGVDVRVALRAIDVDGDERDEAVLVTSDARQDRCVIATVRLSEGPGARVRVLSSLRLPESCSRGATVRARDLDGDRAEDLVVLSGEPGARPHLRVLWNDGGRFALESAQELVERGDPPQAFALFPEHPTDRPRIAVATETRVRWVEAMGASRGFRESGLPADARIARGTGIAADDFDGDRIVDLAVADSGSIRVFQAELESR